MRIFVVVLLFVGSASGVSAQCKQSDLAGRWEFIAESAACQFYLDEDGNVYKAQCWEYETNSDGMGFPSLDEFYLGRATGEFLVNSSCRISRSAIFIRPPYVFDIEVGRVNLDKSIVSGLAGKFAEEDPREGYATVPYTMVRY